MEQGETPAGQQPKQPRATAQSIGAAGLGVLQTAVQLGAGGRRTAPPLHTATEAVGREGLPPQAPAHNTLARSPPKAALGPQQPHAAGAAAEADAGAHDDRLTGWPAGRLAAPLNTNFCTHRGNVCFYYIKHLRWNVLIF